MNQTQHKIGPSDETTPPPASKADELVGYAYGIVAELGSGIKFSVTGSLPKDAPKGVINKEWDLMLTAVERQRTRSMVRILGEKLLTQQRAFKVAADGKEEQDKIYQSREKKTLNTAEKINQEQTLDLLRRAKADIEKTEEDLKKYQEELAAFDKE